MSSTMRGSNGVPLPSEMSNMRRRLAPQQPAEYDRFNNGLPSIQISKVTNGQTPNIPENGIQLRGTSVTLTKIKPQNVDPSPIHNHHLQQQQIQQQQYYLNDSGQNGGNSASSKASRKKKKRGNGVRQPGDDWNLVGEQS